MDPKPDLILYDIEQTRHSLTEKIGLLEDQVKDSVENARTTVENTFDHIKDSVDGSIESFKKVVDPKLQVERHPWGMLSASMATGFFVGNWLVKRQHTVGSPQLALPEGPGLLERLSVLFADEIKLTKSLVLSSAVQSIGHKVKEAFPAAADDIEMILDKTNAKLKQAYSVGNTKEPNSD